MIVKLSANHYLNLDTGLRADFAGRGPPHAVVVSPCGYPQDVHGEHALALREQLEALAAPWPPEDTLVPTGTRVLANGWETHGQRD